MSNPLKAFGIVCLACLVILFSFLTATAQDSPQTITDETYSQLIDRFTTTVNKRIFSDAAPDHQAYQLLLKDILATPALASAIDARDRQIIEATISQYDRLAVTTGEEDVRNICTRNAGATSTTEMRSLALAVEEYKAARDRQLDDFFTGMLDSLSESGTRLLSRHWDDLSSTRQVLYSNVDVVGLAQSAPPAAHRLIQEGCEALASSDRFAAFDDSLLSRVNTAPTAGASSLQCSSPAGNDCTAAAAALLDSDPASDNTQARAVDGKAQPLALLSVTGTIKSVGKDRLTVVNDTGRYFTFSLPANPTISRHTFVNLSEIPPDSVVGIVWNRSAKGEREVISVRVYRNISRESALASGRAPDPNIPGLELRGVLKSISLNARTGSLRLTNARGESGLSISPNAFATIIDAASLSDLKPYSGRARVTAQREADNSLTVRTIEILR